MTTIQIQDTIEHEIGTGGSVRVRGHDGRVELRAVDGSSVRVVGSGERPLDEDFTIRSNRGELTLSAIGDGPFGLHSPSQAIVVEVPRAARVRIETTSGSILAAGLAGDQRYQTMSADIAVDAVAGPIESQTVSGDTWIAATGELRVTAQTVSGDLSIEAATIESLRARTTSGRIWIAGGFSGTGPHAVETVSGDATIAPRESVRVEGSTVSGDLRSALPHRSGGRPGRRSIELGEGGPLIVFRSISGDLDVVDSASTPPRASTSETQVAPPAEPRPEPEPSADTTDDLRLAILRDVEAGLIDVDEADRRLAELDTPAAADAPVGQPPLTQETGNDFGWVRRV